MAIENRLKTYKEIEKLRGNALIVYVTSQRPGAPGIMGKDAVSEFIQQLETLRGDERETVDLLIESDGGDSLVSWRVISMLRERFKRVNVLVPHAAFSAATLLALGADEIIMGPYGVLGPIDPQITVLQKDGSTQKFAYEDIVSFLDFVKDEAGITEQSHLKAAFNRLAEVVEATSLGFAKRSSSLSVSMGEKMLQMHMADSELSNARDIALKLNKSFFSHGHAVSRSEARDIGLKVTDAEETLERLIWSVHIDAEEELKANKPFDPLSEYLRDPKAEPLLKSPPPFNIPPGIDPNTVLQAVQQYLNQQLKTELPEMEFETKHLLLESPRRCACYINRGQLLVKRNFDLQFDANFIRLDIGWKNTTPTGTEESRASEEKNESGETS